MASLDHTQFRQYTSQLARWISPDPAGLLVADPSNPQSWNRYAYVLNNPMNFIDPSGLGPQDCNNGMPTNPDGVITCGDPCSPPSAACDGGGVGGIGPFGGGGGGGGGQPQPPLTGETNGIPNGLPIPGQTIWQILGLPANQNPFIFDYHQDGNGIWVGDYNGEPLCITLLPGGDCIYLYWDLATSTWGAGSSGQVPQISPQPKLKFKPPSLHNFIHEFLPCHGAEFINNFIGNYDQAAVTVGTVALTVTKRAVGGPLLLVWTGINAFKAGAACAIASRAVHE